jgi:hypothetical protein
MLLLYEDRRIGLMPHQSVRSEEYEFRFFTCLFGLIARLRGIAIDHYVDGTPVDLTQITERVVFVEL